MARVFFGCEHCCLLVQCFLSHRLLLRQSHGVRISTTVHDLRVHVRAAAPSTGPKQRDGSTAAGAEVPHGVLRINATFGFGRRHLSPAISEFRGLYPAVEIVLQLTDRTLDLTAHAMDIGIHFGEPPDRRILARKMAPNRRFLCAAPTYLQGRPEPATPRDLHAHECIVIRESSTAFNNWQLSDGQRQEMVKVYGGLSTNFGEIAVDWALAGHGIVLRSEWDIAPYLRSGQLRRVLPG